MVEFRSALREDLPSILELYRQLNPDDGAKKAPDAEAIWASIRSDDKIRYFVAAAGGRVVATCFICIIPNLSRGGRPIGFIENVVTDEKHRRKGIGKKLMGMAVDYARDSGCYKAILQSGIKRTEAHAFYESIGFDGASKRAFEIRFD